MRTKKMFLFSTLIIFVILSVFFINSFLVPTLRCYHARQLSAAEYDKSEFDSKVMAAYPSFSPSNYELVKVSYDEKGYVYLEYIRNKEHTMPIPTDTFDGAFDFIDIFRYDPLWNQIIKL